MAIILSNSLRCIFYSHLIGEAIRAKRNTEKGSWPPSWQVVEQELEPRAAYCKITVISSLPIIQKALYCDPLS